MYQQLEKVTIAKIADRVYEITLPQEKAVTNYDFIGGVPEVKAFIEKNVFGEPVFQLKTATTWILIDKPTSARMRIVK